MALDIIAAMAARLTIFAAFPGWGNAKACDRRVKKSQSPSTRKTTPCLVKSRHSLTHVQPVE